MLLFRTAAPTSQRTKHNGGSGSPSSSSKTKDSASFWSLGWCFVVRTGMGLPGGSEVKNPPAEVRHGFDPWSRMLTHATEQPNPCAKTPRPELTAWEPQLLRPRAAACTLEPGLQTREAAAWEAPVPQLDSSPLSPPNYRKPLQQQDLEKQK